MRGLLAKTNNIARRILSMALAIMMMSSVVQALPEGSLTAHAASGSTNITVHFYNQYNWAEPAMQYWGGTSSTVTGNTSVGTIGTWGVDGYSLTNDGDNWYSLSISGDFTGLQFVDMQNPDSSNSGGIANAYVLACTGDTATDLYVKHADTDGDSNGDTWKWYTDSACTSELTSSEPETNITINLGIPTSWGWTTPTMQYWDCSTVELSGYGAEQEITGWGVNGYTLSSVGTESDIAWYTITLKGNLSGIGTQFLDLANPNGSNTGGSIFINELLSDDYKQDTPTNVYVSYVGSAWTWYKDKALTTTIIPGQETGGTTETKTNITVNLGIPSSWGWTTPTMQYWGCDTAALSGYGAEEAIPDWNVNGYTLTSVGTESDIAWYTITLKGNLSGIGTQFLDLNNPSGSNTGGSIFVNELLGDDYKSDTPINVYVSYVNNAWTWYKDKALTAPVVAPSGLTQQTITVHFNNSENWDSVYAYMGLTSSFKAMTHDSKTVYGYANAWPGAEVEADPDNAGWYSFKITTDPSEYALIFNNNNGSQTENIVFTPSAENTEKWITLTSNSGNRTVAIADTAPAGWVTNTQTINPPVDPYANATYDSPVVNADGSITFNLAKGDYTSAEVMGTVPYCSWTIGSGFAMEVSGDLYTYTTDADVAPGQYEYKIVTNGSNWITDPLCELTKNGNSAVVVPGLSNGEVAPEKGIETDLPATLNLYTVGTLDIATPAVTYTLDDSTLADVVTIDNTNHKITVAKTCTKTEFTLTATDGTNTSKLYVKPQDKVYTYTIYYYDFIAEHMKTDASQIWAWAVDEASITDANDFSGLETLSDGNSWLKAVIKTPSVNIGFKARSYGDWTWETSNWYYKNTAKEENVTLYIVNGDARVYTSIPELVAPRERHIMVAYNRANGDYTDETAGTGWNFYSWNTGFGSETEIYTELMNGEQIMKAPVKDSIADFILAFIVRNSEKAADGEKWIEKDGGDTFVTFPADQEVVKIYFEQGNGIVKTLPYNKSYEIDGATDTITFYYRDDAALAATNSAKLSETVKVVVDGTEYEMTFDAENERYYYALTGCTSKDYTFSYLVGTEVVEDKFASNGVVTYKSFEDLAITASLSQASMDYNDNNVLKVEFAGADAALITKEEVASITADLSQLGLSADFPIAPELMEGTIAVNRGVSGQKEIGITLKDVYGNSYTTSVSVNVIARDADAFDWDEAVIYMTCTDRFFDGNTGNNSGVDKEYSLGYHGGDFAGLTAKMDYLKELGVNTIWITPIVQNSNTATDNGYHGYWASDFTKLSSYLGTEAEFKALLDAAHSRGMKIMVDVVLNHSGYDMEDYFNNIIPGTTMIRDSANTITGDDIYSSLSGLPDFMTEDAAVRDQLVEWQVDWIEKFDIDYYRVDTVKHVDTLTWQAFKNELTKVNPDFKMIGEYYGAGYASTGGALGTGTMDSLLDFDINDKAKDFVTGSISSVESFYSSRNKSLNNTATMGGFLSSHDEDSFVDILIKEKSKTEEEALALAKVAAALQITAKGQVVIYYGEEIGQHGLNNWPTQSNRNDFNWTEADAQNGVAGSMLTHYQKLLDVRSTYSDVISTGTRTTIDANDAAGYDVFKRSLGNEELFVALNIKNEAQTVTFETGAADGTEYKDLYNGGTYTASLGTVTVTIPAAKDGGTVILVKKAADAPVNPPSTGDNTGSSSSNSSSGSNTSSGNAQMKPSTEVINPEVTTDTVKTSMGTLKPVKDSSTDSDDLTIKVETEAETIVPDQVTEITPIVNMKLQLSVKEETLQILDAIRENSLGKDVLDEETLVNVKNALEDEKDIITEIVMDKLEESAVADEIKEALKNALAESSAGMEGATSEIVQYLDLSLLLKTTEGQELGRINKLSKDITFTIAIPEELVKDGREFVVLRTHDEETTVLETQQNDNYTISFQTDRFSTYALAYIDAPVEEAEVEEESVVTEISDVMEITPESDSNVTVFVIIGVVVVGVLLLLFYLYKKNQKN